MAGEPALVRYCCRAGACDDRQVRTQRPQPGSLLSPPAPAATDPHSLVSRRPGHLQEVWAPEPCQSLGPCGDLPPNPAPRCGGYGRRAWNPVSQSHPRGLWESEGGVCLDLVGFTAPTPHTCAHSHAHVHTHIHTPTHTSREGLGLGRQVLPFAPDSRWVPNSLNSKSVPWHIPPASRWWH